MKEKVPISEMTVNKIMSLISEQQLKTGDKLPAERKLSLQLGISRASLREALNLLKAKGVVRIRRGSGVYIDVLDDGFSGSKSLPTENDAFNQLYHLLESRKMIETFAATKLVKTITSQQIEDLKKVAIEEHNRVLFSQGCPEIAKSPHISFESLIVEFIENPFIAQTHKKLSITWKNILDDLNAVVMEPNDRHRQHLVVIDALEQGDSQKVEEAVLEHLKTGKKAIDFLVSQSQLQKKVPS